MTSFDDRRECNLKPVSLISGMAVLQWMISLPSKANPKNGSALKAGALLCPLCCVEFEQIQVDFEWQGRVLKDVKILRCPVCESETFTPEQLREVVRRCESS